MRRFNLFIFFTLLLSLSTYSKDVIDGIVYDTYGAEYLATVIGFEDVGEEVIVPSTITLVEYGKDVIYTVVGIRLEDGISLSVKKIVLPNTITSIGEAFKEYVSLQSIVLPESLECIGKSTFEGCSSLTTINLPNSITAIGEHAFDGCSSLANIILPDKLTRIEGEAFRACTSLTSIVIPGKVSTMGRRVFEDCTSLVDVSFADGGDISFEDETSDDRECVLFENCPVRNLYWGRRILYGVFSGLGSIEKVTIGNSVTKIDRYAFAECLNLSEVSMGNNVRVIGDGAFSGNNQLHEITIPESVDSIGNAAFSRSGLTSVRIPESVKHIGDGAFSNCYKLESAYLPNHLKCIPEGLFDMCFSLSEVNIPQSVEAIGDDAFAYTNISSSYSLPVLKIIGANAFAYCKQLKALNCTPESIGIGCIRGCETLTAINLAQITDIPEFAFSGLKSLRDIGALDKVKTIGHSAFDGCQSLQSVSIPHVERIGAWAFYGCKNLQKVDVGKSLTSFGYRGREDGGYSGSVFRDCTTLKEIALPDGVDSIYEHSFEGCTSLERVRMGKKVAYIGDCAFYGCTQLTDIEFPQTIRTIGWGIMHRAAWNNTLPDGITYIGSCAYTLKGNVTSNCTISIKDGTTCIGGRFVDNCNNPQDIVSVSLPSSIEVISNGAFRGCRGLTSLTIPENVVFIDAWAFAGINLKEVYAMPSFPPATEEGIFSDWVYENATLYVPLGSLNFYTEPTGNPYQGETGNHEEWRLFKNVEERNMSGISSPLIRSTMSSGRVYNLSGHKLTSPQKGINIIDGQKVVVK